MTDVDHIFRALHGKYGPGEWELAQLADSQGSVIARRQLVELGIGEDAIEYHVHIGRLHPLFTGVYAVGTPTPSPRGRFMGALLSCGDGALLSHRSAGAHRNLLGSAWSDIDVTVLRGRCAGRDGIRVHRARRLHPDDREEVDGIPVTSLARTLVDLAEVLPRRKLVYALEQAERMQALDVQEIEACIGRNRGRRGIQPLRQAIREIEPEAMHTRSKMERLLIAFCRRYEIEAPAMNVSVDGYTVDAYWPEARLIVELDSWEHHKTRRSFEEDRRRDAVLGENHRLLRVTHRWLTREPDDLAAAIRRRLTSSPSRAPTP